MDPATLRLQRKYKPFTPCPIKVPTVFCGVRLGYVPGIYTSWKEAKPHPLLIRSAFKRFETREKEKEYVAQLTSGQPPLPFPDDVLYTDGSAFLSVKTTGRGVYANRFDNSETSLWDLPRLKVPFRGL